MNFASRRAMRTASQVSESRPNRHLAWGVVSRTPGISRNSARIRQRSSEKDTFTNERSATRAPLHEEFVDEARNERVVTLRLARLGDCQRSRSHRVPAGVEGSHLTTRPVNSADQIELRLAPSRPAVARRMNSLSLAPVDRRSVRIAQYLCGLRLTRTARVVGRCWLHRCVEMRKRTAEWSFLNSPPRRRLLRCDCYFDPIGLGFLPQWQPDRQHTGLVLGADLTGVHCRRQRERPRE